jgi:Kef-type K+ transport system membrane component KefB
MLLTLASDAASAHSRNIALDLVIILAAAAGMVMLLRKFRVAAIPAYLLTGALIGPHALGLVRDAENIESISGLATILLMFIVGLHLDPRGLGGGMVRIGAVCVAATVGSALAMWPLLGSGQFGWPAGLAVAMALTMTSTAVVLRIMQERREMHKVHGRMIFGSLVVQDLLALVILAILPLLATWAKATPTGDIEPPMLLPQHWPAWGKFMLAIGGIGVLIAVCRLILPLLLNEAGKHTSKEVPLVLSAAIALGAAILAAGLGFSPELGAFLAGFLLSGTAFRHQLSGQLVPLRDLFMAVFFTAVGLRLNIAVLADGWPIILVATLALVLVKTSIFAMIAWLLGATAPTAVFYGMAMFSAGEFAIVILSVAEKLGLYDAQAMSIIVVVVVLSLLITPTMYSLGHRLRPAFAKIPPAGWSSSTSLRDPPENAEESTAQAQAAPNTATPRTVIIAGFGVVGRSIADRLEVQKIPFLIVDLNQQTIQTQRKLNRQAIYGDVANPDVLEAIDVEHAAAVVLTIPDDEATLRACRTIRTLAPHVFISARTSFLSKALAAMQAGADQVTIEEVATAELMAKNVMSELAKRTQPSAAQPASPASDTPTP